MNGRGEFPKFGGLRDDERLGSQHVRRVQSLRAFQTVSRHKGVRLGKLARFHGIRLHFVLVHVEVYPIRGLPGQSNFSPKLGN